jgi:replicative DNA helicase
LIEYRNYIAHELLFDDALTKSLLSNNASKNHYSKNHRILYKAILELEQLVFLFDWTNANDRWN